MWNILLESGIEITRTHATIALDLATGAAMATALARGWHRGDPRISRASFHDSPLSRPFHLDPVSASSFTTESAPYQTPRLSSRVRGGLGYHLPGRACTPEPLSQPKPSRHLFNTPFQILCRLARSRQTRTRSDGLSSSRTKHSAATSSRLAVLSPLSPLPFRNRKHQSRGPPGSGPQT